MTVLFDARHETAFRLFNGFTEGRPALAVGLYAQALVLHDYAETPEEGQAAVAAALTVLSIPSAPDQQTCC